MDIRLVAEIDAPVSAVWTILDDSRNLPKWVPEVIETTFPDGENRDNPVGSRFRQKLREGRRVKEYEGVVTAHERLRLLAIRMLDRHFVMDLTYRLSEDRGGTRLEYELHTELKSLAARVLSFLARPLTMRIVTRQLAALKKLAEAGSAGR